MRRGWARAAAPLGAALLLGVVAAACSSSPGTAGRSTTTSRPLGTTTTTSRPPGTTTTTGAATTTTTTPGVTTCLARQLSVVPQQGSGAAGTIYLTVTLTDTATSTCTLSGYPGMQLLGAQGTDIPTTVVRGGLGGGAPAAAQQAPAVVTLAPQQSATFAIEFEDVPVGNETSCPTSAKAEITPPNDVTPAVVTLTIAPCDNGTVHVSPVFATG